jgi:NitT/TauT family transport system substrate-binding protein
LAADLAIAVAAERGYFRQEAVDAELIGFTNASEMIPALATDQVDVAGFGSNAATWNAAARGVPFKLVLA